MRRLSLTCAVLAAACGSKGDERKPPTRTPSVDAEPPPIAATPAPDATGSSADPDYPTPRRAGTDLLFVVEEPVRGPHVTKLAIPARKKLKFTQHAYCEIDEVTVVCTDAAPDAGDLASVAVASERGKPVLVEWRRGKRVDQTVVLDYDAKGFLEQMARLDATGTIDWVRSYEPAGRRYTARELDGENALPGCGAIELKLDGGRVTASTCLQWIGDPMRNTNGVVTTELERDATGFVIAEQRRGPGGKLTAGTRDQVHRIEITRDAKGRRTQERYFAVGHQAAGNADVHGCTGLDFDYTRNQESTRTCASGPDEDGVTVTETTRDAAGCSTGSVYRDAARDGTHQIQDEVDDRCLVTSSTCRDLYGDPIACGPKEPAVYRYTRDDHGRVTSETYEDPSGTRTTDPSYEAYELRRAWDRLGRRTEQACFDQDGVPMECGNTGFHRMVETFDAVGREIEERFFDTDGQPATNMGAVSRTYTYDNYDHLYEQRDHDADGNTVEIQGMAFSRNYYDDSHRLYGVVMFDAQGEPAMYTSCYTGLDCPSATTGWHAVALIRSPTGKVLQNKFFDTAGKQIEVIDCRDHQCWVD